MTSAADDDRRWGFVTNHARVLACIVADPNTRLRDIATAVGITERTAGQIVNDLQRAGYLTKTRDGRRNQYVIDGKKKLQHPRLKGVAATQVIAVLVEIFDQQPFG